MHEEENRREEKLEGRDIRLGGLGAAKRPERQHGKFYRWLDNFWYHNKWKTIITAFFLIVFIVCTVQICKKEPERDVNILIAGPTNFTNESAGTTELEALLSSYVQTDYNGDGSKNVSIRFYTVLSQEQIKKIESTKDENGGTLQVDHSAVSSNYSDFYSYLSTGETAILILDRWIYEEIKAKGWLVDLSTQLEDVPDGAILGSGEGSYYGIALRETEIYQSQMAFQVLDEEYITTEPVICMMSKLITTTDGEKYDAAMDFLKTLFG